MSVSLTLSQFTEIVFSAERYATTFFAASGCCVPPKLIFVVSSTTFD